MKDKAAEKDTQRQRPGAERRLRVALKKENAGEKSNHTKSAIKTDLTRIRTSTNQPRRRKLERKSTADQNRK